jgi:uncharacterized protein with von Willebrand factor type A (vWA) domain
MQHPALGQTLVITTSYGSTRTVRVYRSFTGQQLLVDCRGEVLEGERIDGLRSTVISWTVATPEQRAEYETVLQTTWWANEAELHGAPALIAELRRCYDDARREEEIHAVADELVRRGKAGKASQVRAYALSESGRYSIVSRAS